MTTQVSTCIFIGFWGYRVAHSRKSPHSTSTNGRVSCTRGLIVSSLNWLAASLDRHSAAISVSTEFRQRITTMYTLKTEQPTRQLLSLTAQISELSKHHRYYCNIILILITTKLYFTLTFRSLVGTQTSPIWPQYWLP